MKQISIEELNENFIESIGHEWMLITAGTPNHFNTMTASWGGIGFLWNRPVVFIFIRPERYTFEFVNEQEEFTLCFLGDENKNIHKICGSKSGRDTDKIAESGLCPMITEHNNVIFEQCRLALECKKLYTDVLKAENFIETEIPSKWYGDTPGTHLHHIFVAEITAAWRKSLK